MPLNIDLSVLRAERERVRAQKEKALQQAAVLTDREKKLEHAIEAVLALDEPYQVTLELDNDEPQERVTNSPHEATAWGSMDHHVLYRDWRALADGQRRLAAGVRVESEMTVRERIVRVFVMAKQPLSRSDVVDRLRAAGHNINEATVASTLSRMLAGSELEKANNNFYSLPTPHKEKGSDAPTSDPLNR